MKSTLQMVRMYKKKTFLISNYHHEYLDLIMKTGLDTEHWLDHFDYVFLDARKPLWFKTRAPFYEWQGSSPTRKGAELHTANLFIHTVVFEQRRVFLQGNAHDFTKHYWIETKKPRVALFGSHLIHDVGETQEFNEQL